MEERIVATIGTAEDEQGNVIAVTDVNIGVFVKKRGAHWIASCPYFLTFGSSKISAEDAIHDFDIALKTFFLVHIQRGTLNKALTKFGWTKHNHDYKNNAYFNIPSYLLQGEVRQHHVAVA